MAAGEYVSVSSQRDTENADLNRERAELASSPRSELEELAAIYERRGVSTELAHQVAVELTRSNPLEAHARDELGIDPAILANPVQASTVSALSFVVGAALPIVVIALAPASARVIATVIITLVGLVILGSVGARLGGAPQGRAAIRVFVGGCLALLISLGIGKLTGSIV